MKTYLITVEETFPEYTSGFFGIGDKTEFVTKRVSKLITAEDRKKAIKMVLEEIEERCSRDLRKEICSNSKKKKKKARQ